MAITDELRKWAHGPDEGDDWLDRIDEFCDRIDAAHRSALEKLAAQLDESERSGFDQGFASADDWLAQNEDAMAEHGWMHLPVDADGVPIHVGDMVEDASVREIVERVMQIRYTLTTSGISPTVLTSIITDASQLPQKPNDYRHHRAPTVEDVLREFAREIDADAYGITDAKVAEFAAKLRLAEGVDQ